MSAHTTLLYFKVKNLDFAKENDKQKVVDTVSKEFSQYGYHNLDPVVNESFKNGSFLHLFVNSAGNHIVLKGHHNGIVTVDIHEFMAHDLDKTFNRELVLKLEDSLKRHLKTEDSKSFPAVRRGDEVDTYYPTVDGRMAEYDFVEVLKDVQSPFQRVQVLRSQSLGNVLVLDGDINMGEGDLLYSHTLMQKGKISYKGKSCLILGGGDGGLLHEIVQEDPQMVVLVDIDEEVIRACKELLPGVHKGVLNRYKSTNYEIIIGDALEYMRTCVKAGKTFDYVLYDITAVPVTKEPLSSEWEFLEESIRLSLQVLGTMEHSRFLCHSTAQLAKESLKMFDALLAKLDSRLQYLKHPAFIPSFHEVSLFYEIWLPQN